MSKDLKSLLVAILLSTLVLIGWQYFYESPNRAQIEKAQEIAKQAKIERKEQLLKQTTQTILNEPIIGNDAVGQVTINTEKLKGSISLKGLRFDDLQLKAYRETLASNSPLERLFSDKGAQAYFAEFGWIKDSSDQALTVPDKNSVWQCDYAELTSSQPISCYWQGGNVNYFIDISVDQDYLFTITQIVENKSSNRISIANYGRIYKARSDLKQFAILHEGAIGVFSDILKEVTYEDMSKERQEIFTNTPGSWAGITNKYWLSALIPDPNFASKTNFIASTANDGETGDNYNVNYISQDITLNPGEKIKSVNNLFAGAKEEKLLARYTKDNHFVLFDRAIDFGIFYFITKPLFWLISYFYSLMGNFGLAIIGVTFTLKLLMYPLASKSFRSMKKMKELQPKIEAIKLQYADDKIKFNQEMMALYKKEKINPASGCLPLLIQIPLFFSLYKVIFISIEMRHAPFYGWIKDLSAPDPTSIWNLFGILPWSGFGMLDIGLWPFIMGVTMYIQQKLGPEPTDPVQAAVMKFMPLVLMVMLYDLPSGLMIYWSFSNILSIVQQQLINRGSSPKVS